VLERFVVILGLPAGVGVVGSAGGGHGAVRARVAR
jgi:hypothetical protein